MVLILVPCPPDTAVLVKSPMSRPHWKRVSIHFVKLMGGSSNVCGPITSIPSPLLTWSNLYYFTVPRVLWQYTKHTIGSFEMDLTTVIHSQSIKLVAEVFPV